MAKITLLIAIAFAAYLLYKQLKSSNISQQKTHYVKLTLLAVSALLLLGVALGKMHWFGAILGAMLPFIQRLIPLAIRLFPLLQIWKKQQISASRTSGGQSSVTSKVLEMTLEHDSGELNGKVICGSFTGRYLQDCSTQELQQLYDFCSKEDKESKQLLESYLNHRYGEQWYTEFNTTENNNDSTSSNMTDKAEALATLGLEDGASKEEIINAHRKLMQKLHPDRGGNDYLAAKLNLAKDFLLK